MHEGTQTDTLALYVTPSGNLALRACHPINDQPRLSHAFYRVFAILSCKWWYFRNCLQQSEISCTAISDRPTICDDLSHSQLVRKVPIFPRWQYLPMWETSASTLLTPIAIKHTSSKDFGTILACSIHTRQTDQTTTTTTVQSRQRNKPKALERIKTSASGAMIFKTDERTDRSVRTQTKGVSRRHTHAHQSELVCVLHPLLFEHTNRTEQEPY